MSNKNGQKWIRDAKRLAIYLRDGLACCYCGATVEDGAKFTLDHLKPTSKGGTNHEHNLITCCSICNSSRGARSWSGFAAKVAAYRNIAVNVIVRHIENSRKRLLPMDEAKSLIERRGGFTAAVHGGREGN